MRTSKLCGIDAAAALVHEGAHVAFGGFTIHNKPAAFIRALVRAGTKALHLYSCPTASIDADLLIGAGQVVETVVGSVTFDHLGRAPRFSAAVERDGLQAVMCDEAALAGGLMATVEGIPYHPLASAKGHGAATSRLLTPYRSHTGHDLVAASPIAPDVAVLHVQQADEYGNALHFGSVWADVLLAKASRTVVLTVDEVVPTEVIAADPRLTSIPAYLVDAVVPLPFGAHPCSSHGRYGADEHALREYLAAAADDDAFGGWVERFVVEPGSSQDAYLEAVGWPSRSTELMWGFPWSTT